MKRNPNSKSTTEKLMKFSILPTTRRRQTTYGLAALAVLAVMCAGVFYVQAGHSDDQDIQKLNRFVQGSKPDSPAMKTFREGRDLIESEDWPQAAEKFQGFVKEYPKDKDVDAALYWLAYALKKQGKKDEAAPPLLRLIKEFPKSSWRREAEAMLVELGYGDAVNQALTKAQTDNENCEMKILALQSLFEADEDRAISYSSQVLKTSSADCPALRAAAVSLRGEHGGPRATPILLEIARSNPDLKLRLTAIRRLGENESDSVAEELAKLYDADSTKEVRIQILRAFAEMHSPRAEAKLVEVARSGNDLELRQYAIRCLGEHDGAASLDTLIGLYDSDKTPEIRSQILRALSERDDPRAQAKLLDIARRGETPELRIEAIRRVAEHGGIALDDLLGLYSDETNEAIKEGLLHAYSEIDDPRAIAKLAEVATRSTEKLDLRLSAIRGLGNHDNPQVTAELIAMYDAEQNVQVRAALIRAFGESKDKAAVRKLIAIARGDSSMELRKLAVRKLGESKDPEALKFLEELLK
jgi:HEAT repeat protein